MSHKQLEKINKMWIYIGFASSFLGTSLFQYWMHVVSGSYYVRYADIGILVSGTLLFEIIRKNAEKVRGIVPRPAPMRHSNFPF